MHIYIFIPDQPKKWKKEKQQFDTKKNARVTCRKLYLCLTATALVVTTRNNTGIGFYFAFIRMFRWDNLIHWGVKADRSLSLRFVLGIVCFGFSSCLHMPFVSLSETKNVDHMYTTLCSQMKVQSKSFWYVEWDEKSNWYKREAKWSRRWCAKSFRYMRIDCTIHNEVMCDRLTTDPKFRMPPQSMLANFPHFFELHLKCCLRLCLLREGQQKTDITARHVLTRATKHPLIN